jgi:hypothetical protein
MENHMSHFDQFIQYRALKFKFSSLGTMTLDDLERMVAGGSVGHAVDGVFVPATSIEEMSSVPLRNVCAKLAFPLVERLDNALGVLDISKRQFIELAIIEALDKVDQYLVDVDAFEYVDARAEEAQ